MEIVLQTGELVYRRRQGEYNFAIVEHFEHRMWCTIFIWEKTQRELEKALYLFEVAPLRGRQGRQSSWDPSRLPSGEIPPRRWCSTTLK